MVIKQEEIYEATNAIADTGSQFSLMSRAFAESCNIGYKASAVKHEFKLLDVSGSQLPLVGYANVKLKNSVKN